MENKIKHLEFIQNTINRLSGHSFFLKGWSITIAVGLSALFVNGGRVEYALIANIAFIIFWILDAYFLYQERLYRALYDTVRKLKDEDIDFSMQKDDFRGGKETFIRSFIAPVLVVFYFPIIIIIQLLYFILIY